MGLVNEKYRYLLTWPFGPGIRIDSGRGHLSLAITTSSAIAKEPSALRSGWRMAYLRVV